MTDTVLVTGAFGLVGSETVRQLMVDGPHVVATDLDVPANRKAAEQLPSDRGALGRSHRPGRGRRAAASGLAGGDHPSRRDHSAGLLRPAGAGPQGQRRRDGIPARRRRRAAGAAAVRPGLQRRHLRRPQPAPRHRRAHRRHPAAAIRHLRRPQGRSRETGARIRAGLGDPATGRRAHRRAAARPRPGHHLLRGVAARSTAASRPSTCAMSRAPSSRRPPRRSSARRC